MSQFFVSTSSGGGSGNVTGPSSSVSGDIAIFSGTTGKVIADSGTQISSLLDITGNTATQFNVVDDCDNISWWDLRQTGSAHSGIVPSATNPGIIQLEVFNSSEIASGNYTGATQTNNPNFIFGGGPFTYQGLFNIATLGNVTDTYQFYAGMHDGWQFSGPNNGTYFIYDSTVSLNWQFATNIVGSSTINTSSVPVTTGWHKLMIQATTTSATYFVDGVSLGTISTNMPTSNGYNLNGHKIVKTLGSASIVTQQDKFSLNQTLTTPR